MCKKKIKEAVDTVDTAHKVGDGIVSLAGIVIPIFAVGSSTLRYWMIIGGFLGGALGFYITVRRWQGQPRKSCLKRGEIHFVLAVLTLGLLISLLVVLKPEFALLNHWLIQIRELLLRTGFLPNLLAGLLSLLTMWLIIGAITLHSKRLCT